MDVERLTKQLNADASRAIYDSEAVLDGIHRLQSAGYGVSISVDVAVDDLETFSQGDA